jgi:anti-sigma regulatory factor (Ser/Thr protein kinase)
MLPQEAGAVRTARTSVEQWLGDAPARVRDDARSVVTELVSNAVRYGRPPIHLGIERHGGEWHIDVADSGNRRFGPRAGNEQGGWGLRIVGALAEDWGIAEDASRVWCVLRADDPPAKSHRASSGEGAPRSGTIARD